LVRFCRDIKNDGKGVKELVIHMPIIITSDHYPSTL
jgi:hypothetical protein